MFEKLGEPAVSPLETVLMGSAHKPWMFRLYTDLSLHGPKSSEVARDLAAEFLRRENMTEKKLMANKKYRDQSLASQLSMIAAKLFGPRGAAQRPNKNGLPFLTHTADPEKVLLHLTEQERKAVQTVFENQKKAVEARMRND